VLGFVLTKVRCPVGPTTADVIQTNNQPDQAQTGRKTAAQRSLAAQATAPTTQAIGSPLQSVPAAQAKHQVAVCKAATTTNFSIIAVKTGLGAAHMPAT